MIHNREQEPSNYEVTKVLIYPLEINSITYIHDGRANVNMARVMWVGRDSGTLLPVLRSGSGERSPHSSHELWAAVGEVPLGNYQDPEATV